MAKMTLHQVEMHHPDLVMPPLSRECAPTYWQAVEAGEQSAKCADVTFLGLCRNSMPQVQLNTQRLERLASRFRSWKAFIYENDSEDGTAEYLQKWASEQPHATVMTEKHGRPLLSHEKSKRRTDALSEYRNACVAWARERQTWWPSYVVVIDFDTWAGWSDDGVMTGLHWLEELPGAAGMASVSTVEMPVPGHPEGKMRIHYDSWAFRWNYWTEHDMAWFPHWFPPAGSRPVACNSAFGGMAIYRPSAFFSGTYSGPDCEHVAFHRKIYETTTMRMFLNPGQRIVMNWMPDERQHSDD